VIVGTKLAAARMVPRGRGHVVNISSLAGEMPTPGLATYSASKAAVLAFTDALRAEYHGTGVQFSTVLPTFTNTELTSGTLGPKGFRNAEPEEIAAAVVSLLVKPRRRAAVTKIAGVISRSQDFMPSRLVELLGRNSGMESVFLDGVDVEARRAYEDRARGIDVE
jgi:short-subunit dehydrogenase